MTQVRQYLLSIIAAALLVSLGTAWADRKSEIGGMIRTLGSVFLVVATISPISHFQYQDMTEYWNSFSAEAKNSTQYGIQIQRSAAGEIIKEKTESYILDKAKQFGAALIVQVSLSDDELQTPSAVQIRGRISPYGKRELEAAIEKDLGIPKEKQTWIE